MKPTVIAVSRDPNHRFSKNPVEAGTMVAGIGIAGDAHAGTRVQHRSRVAADSSQPNLRQVHLLQSELFDEPEAQGFGLAPGLLGENITTRGLHLLALPGGSRLRIGATAVIEVTGLRNPCSQIDGLARGLSKEAVHRDTDGLLVRRAGIMGIVAAGGEVVSGDAIVVELPDGPHEKLERV